MEIKLFTLTNSSGASISVTNFGAALVSAVVPDRDGNMVDVVLGYKDVSSYRQGDNAYMGKSVGRYANRMGGARFSLDGVEYKLAANEGENQLHGGSATLANKLWNVEESLDRIVFSIESPDGEGGYPGNMKARAIYRLSDDNELEITYEAECDAPTVVNFTNHAYFNLAGEGSGNVLEQVLKLDASNFLPTDHTSIPTGKIWPVDDTPMDFRTAKPLGRDIDADYQQITWASGYDRCWVIDDWKKGELKEAGLLTCPENGCRMRILTTQPGIQVYTGNFLRGRVEGKSGRPYNNRDGVALECQGFPDAPNHPNFPSQVLRPGEKYVERVIYKFETDRETL